MTEFEKIIVDNYRYIADLYEVIATITELRSNEEDHNIRTSYTSVIVATEEAIENLKSANEALEEC